METFDLARSAPDPYWAFLVVTFFVACGDTTTEPPPDPPRATTITVTPATADLAAPGATVQLSAEVLDQNGQVMAGATVTWSSSAAAVATVDASGLVKDAGEGTATITATAGGASGTTAITVASSDRAALVALYNATGGANWVNNENWLTDKPLREWYGVDTDASRRVVSIYLDGRFDSGTGRFVSHGLTGEMPTELGDLTSLTILSLASNDLSGDIPVALGRLASLEQLSLGDNQLTGGIPAELGDLASLTILSLASNDLSGEIPAELGQLASLEQLSLGDNQLTGEIPAELGGLASLQTLDLWTNQLTGEIPAELGGLASLEELWLSNNRLTGEIPTELGGLTSLERLSLRNNQLTGGIPAELGDLASLKSLSLSNNRLTGGIPAELGDLTSLWQLNLSGNQLTGEIPAELGGLTSLGWLYLHDNPQLAGALPLALASLSALSVFWYYGTGLCVPSDESFRAWLGSITHVGTVDCPPSERDVLEALYHATGGPGWTNSGNWLTDAPLRDWDGVTTDADGRVTALDVSGNGLAGQIPAELGGLASLQRLYLNDNQLTGVLRLALASLSALELFWYEETGLCVPADESFRTWLGSIPNHRGTGADCVTRDILEALYHATGGPGWTNSTGWLTDTPLGDWYGVQTDSAGGVVGLNLLFNQLTGEIPAELGGLASLELLQLSSNRLTGKIPPKLGGLAGLELLSLGNNPLTGGIPAELGGLASLEELSLYHNQLTGEIPAELGGLASLKELWLSDNQLTGEIPVELGALGSLELLMLHRNVLMGGIPAELGGLASLRELSLSENALTGGIPAELGGLTSLESLGLGNNQLTGGIPTELGGLGSLRSLSINLNYGLTGALPLSLAALSALELFHYGATRLCVPADESFRAWLNAIANHRGTGVGCGFTLDSRIVGQVLIEGTGIDDVTVHLSNGDSTATSGGGNYSFDNVEVGSYTVTISGYPSDVSFGATSAAATISSAGQSVTVNFTGSYIRTASILVSVTVDSIGLGGVTVRLSGLADATATTGNDGGIAFTGLRAGSYSVEISGYDTDYGFGITSKDVAVGVGQVADVTFEGFLSGTSGISGRVSVDGGGMADATVTVSADGIDDVTATTDAGGQYSFAGLAAGDYTVGISGYDTDDYEFEVTSKDVTVARDQTLIVNFEGRAGGGSNQSPVAVGTIPSTTVNVAGRVGVNVASYFSDPDGDALTYGASTSDTAVATPSVSGSTVTVTGVAAGAATMTVTARDPGGLSATQAMDVTVTEGNQSPVAVGTIPSTTVKAGESVSVNASSYFSDPDGDALTYGASTSDTAVATPSVSGSTVTVTGVAAGAATMTVTARDPGGLSATQAMDVTVTEGNQSPVAVGTIPSTTVKAGESVSVNASSYFSDPDGDALTYAASTSDAAVATASVSSSTVTVTGVGAGAATVTVTARDPGGLSATQAMGVTVTEDGGNRSPVAVGTISSTTVKAAESVSVNASSYFSDPDGDALTYVASTSDAAVATASVSGSTVTVTGVAAGAATVTVTARDPGGLSATQTFTVTVEAGTGGDFKTLAGLRVLTDGTVRLQASGITFEAGSTGGCIVTGTSGTNINGQIWAFHETWWQRNTGSGWMEVAGTKKTGRLCGYDLRSAPSGRYRLVGDMTVAGARDNYKSENEVTR